MEIPLIIGGVEITRECFRVASAFYDSFTTQVANARLTDVAAAIGCARQADRGDLSSRKQALHKAAQSFNFSQQDLEHAVRMLGTPLQVVEGLFEDIPRWLNGVPRLQETRFNPALHNQASEGEAISAEMRKIYAPREGFCYAVTPGNDPRSSALVAANLGYLGIPFILRASPKDAVAPLVIKALINGGFDPNFCSLLYFDSPGASQKNFKLVEAASTVWTFGPRQLVDSKLRYEVVGRRAVLQLLGGVENPDPQEITALAASQGFTVEDVREDHFQGKVVLRHESGNCAAILYGAMDDSVRNVLERSILFPLGCTDTKSIYLVEPAGDWMTEMEAFLEELVVGDPLDADTQVGFVDPGSLDALERLVEKNHLWLQTLGGERISRHQARPLLVVSQEGAGDFYRQEIPAYVLAFRECENVDQAGGWINQFTGAEPRLAVSLLNLPKAAGMQVASRLKAHAVMVDRPTTQVVPILHEGNDYALSLRRGKLILGDWQGEP